MGSRLSLRAYLREREFMEAIRVVVDQAIRDALVNQAGLEVYDARHDTGPDGDCDDVLFRQLRPISPSQMEQAVLGYAGSRAVDGTYTVHSPDYASIQMERT